MAKRGLNASRKDSGKGARGVNRRGKAKSHARRREWFLFSFVFVSVTLLLLFLLNWWFGKNKDGKQVVKQEARSISRSEESHSLSPDEKEQQMSDPNENVKKTSHPERRISPLEEQIGAVVDVYPTDPRGQEVMAILEEAFADDPPGIRTAKWIDELPATLPPAPPDIEPTLPPEVLFHDLDQANAHWEAFQKRNPRTAAFFIKRNIRPTITEMPGDEGEPYDPVYKRDYGQNWGRYAALWLKRDNEYTAYSDLNREPDRVSHLKELGACVLLRDFLNARGGEPGKRAAFYFKRMVQSSLYLPLREFRSEEAIHPIVAETVWPYLDIEAGRCTINDIRQLSGELTHKEYLRLDKWGLNNGVPCRYPSDRRLTLVTRLNTYVKAKDYGGQIICCYAYDPSAIRLRPEIEIGFRKRFGDEIGMKKLKRYFELVEAIQAEQFPCPLTRKQ